MRDVDLYRQILGLPAPWFVSEVKLDLEGQRVEVQVEHPEGQRWRCPQCGQELPIHDHAPERSWRLWIRASCRRSSRLGSRGCVAQITG